jgi:predicted deacylase
MYIRGMVYSYHDGLFEPFKGIADQVAEGQAVGLVHHPETPWQAPDTVHSPHAGMVLCKRAFGQVQRGDAVFQIAADLTDG